MKSIRTRLVNCLLSAAVVANCQNLVGQTGNVEMTVVWDQLRVGRGVPSNRLLDSLRDLRGDQAELARLLIQAMSQGEAAHQLADVEQRIGRLVISHQAWPWAWLSLGLARAQLAENQARAREGPLQPVGSSYRDGAFAALQRALEIDSTFAPAALVLVRLLHDSTSSHSDSEAVRRVVNRLSMGPTPPPTSITLAQLEFQAADDDVAGMEQSLRVLARAEKSDTLHAMVQPILLMQARRAIMQDKLPQAETLLKRFADTGGDSAVYLFYSAIVRFAEDRAAEGTKLYYQGASLSRSDAARALYYGDVSLVAISDEAGGIDDTNPENMDNWLHYFWNSRDVADGQSIGTRLAEHRRRVLYAMRHYAHLPGVAVQDWQWNAALEEPDQAELEELPFLGTPGLTRPEAIFDDRGLVYIRHGEPDRTANHAGVGHWYNESWLYERPGEPLVLHFHTPTLNPPDFRLVASPVGELMISCQLDARYCVRAGTKAASGQVSRETLDRDRAIELARIERARTTDANPIRFQARLQGLVRAYSLPGENGQTRLITGVIVSARQVVSAAQKGFRANLSLAYYEKRAIRNVVWDPADLVPVSSHELGTVLITTVEPGNARVGIVLEDSSHQIGLSASDSSYLIPDLSQNLQVSDIVMGHPDFLMRFHLGDLEVSIDPRHRYATGSPMTSFYAVTGLTPGASVHTRIVLTKGRQSVLEIGFDETASTATQYFTRVLQLNDLNQGDYELRVVVTDRASQRTAERAQVFSVVTKS